jgi:ribonuclease P protein component
MRKTDEFSSVFRLRCLRGVGGLDVLAAPNGLDHARLGMIVPKRIVATAVERNRIKRILREGFRLRQAGLVGLDVVARVRDRVEVDTLDQSFATALDQVRTRVASRVAASPERAETAATSSIP